MLSRVALQLAACSLLALGLSSLAHGQESSFPLRVEADDGTTVRLTLGVDPDATSGIDNGEGSTEDIGEESLPPLGTTVFEARFTSGTLQNDLSEGVSRDIRKKTDPLGDPFDGTKTHEVTFVIPSGADVTLDWDFPSGAEGELTSDSGLSKTLSGDNQATVSPGELTEVTGPGNANTYRATLEVTYNGLTGGGPAASDDQFQVTEDQPEDLDVLSNDSDPESDPLRPSVVQGEGPDNGTVSFNSADNTFTYNPDDDFNGTDSFTYEVADGFGGRDEADVTVNVSAVNDAPTVSTNSDLTLDEGATSSITTGELSASDVDDSASDLTFSVTSGPSNGTLLVGGSQASSFTQRDLESGSVEYAHDGSETTSDSFTFDLTDAAGEGPSGQTFDITVNAVNDAPTFENEVGDNKAVDEDQTAGPYSFTISDAETQASNLTLSGTSDNTDLVPSDNIEFGGSGKDRTVTVTPRPDSNGTAGIELTVSDGQKTATSTFNLAVSAVNDPPTVSTNAGLTVEVGANGSITTGQLSATDVDDSASDLTFSVTAGPDDGSLLVGGSKASSFTQEDLESGSVEYRHDGSSVGSDSFTFDLTDAAGAGPSGESFDISIVSANDPPTVSTNSGLTLDEGATSSITTGELSASDVDDTASDLTFSVTSGPSNGTLLVGGSQASSFTQRDLERGSVEYAHDGSETTSDSFTFDLTDANGAGPFDRTFDIEITSVNDPPTISEIGDQTIEEDGQLGPLDLTASDPETPAEDLSLFGESSNPDLVPADSIVFSGPGPDSTATVAVSPRSDSSGTAQIDLVLSDGELRDTSSFELTVEAVNDTPQVATNAGLAVEEGDTTSITTGQLSATDVDDSASSLTFSVTSGPDHGALLVGGSETSSFTQEDLEDGAVEYAHDGSETTSDGFTFDLTDAAGAGPSGQTFDIEITSVNDPPTISEVGDQTIDEDGQLGPLDLTASDPETPAEDLSLFGESSNPDLVPADSIVFSGPSPDSMASVKVSPRPDSNGTAQIDLVLSDGELRDTTSFELTVEAVNDPPSVIFTLSGKTLRVPGPPLQLIGLAESLFRDPEGEELSVSASPEDSSIVRSIGNRPGGVALRPESTGATSVTITASDGTAETSTSFTATVEEREGEEPAARAVVIINDPGERLALDLGETGSRILAKGVDGDGSVEVRRFGSAPADTTGISEENVSQYRTVITASPTLSFGSGTEVRFPVGNFPGIEDPTAVTVYSRPEEGEGTFEALPTSVDDGGTPDDPSDDEIIATTGSFSEFVLASDTEPLPVELVSFEATRDGEGSVHLEWRTASETNNAGFRIQRTAGTGENASWSNVGFVDSKVPDGSTTEPKSYRFTDGDLPYEAEAVRYRLKQVDTDGTAGYSDPVTVKRRVTEVELLGTYPNPAQTQATVRYALPEKQNVSIHLYDVLGRQVRTVVRGEKSGRHKRRVDLSGLPSGVYFLRLTAGDDTRTRKLTVVR